MPSYAEHVQELSNKLTAQTHPMSTSGSYYDATYRVQSIGLSTPPAMRKLMAAIGWPRMYVDSIEERLDIEGFRIAGESQVIENLTDWWQINGLDELSGMAHLDALIYGRSYITVSMPGANDRDLPAGVPVIRVESPLNMYAEFDVRTNKVTRAIRVYEDNEGEYQQAYATLYLPDRTVPMKHNGNTWVPDGKVFKHNLGIVPVVPILNRERLEDRDGYSEIVPELRSLTDAASRVMMNMQAAAELMAVPQRVLFGVDSDALYDPAQPGSGWDAYLAQIIAFENEAGKAFQFDAAELRNFTEVLEQLAKHVASYTGLPPQYLSFNSDNPASAEAIKSAESRLVKKCERKARMFGGPWEDVMRLATKLAAGNIPQDMYRLETVWRDPSTPTFASKADAVTKMFANGTGVIPKERARIDMGYTTQEREEMRQWDQDDRMAAFDALAAAASLDTGNNNDPGSSGGGAE